MGRGRGAAALRLARPRLFSRAGPARPAGRRREAPEGGPHHGRPPHPRAGERAQLQAVQPHQVRLRADRGRLEDPRARRGHGVPRQLHRPGGGIRGDRGRRSRAHRHHGRYRQLLSGAAVQAVLRPPPVDPGRAGHGVPLDQPVQARGRHLHQLPQAGRPTSGGAQDRRIPCFAVRGQRLSGAARRA